MRKLDLTFTVMNSVFEKDIHEKNLFVGPGYKLIKKHLCPPDVRMLKSEKSNLKSDEAKGFDFGVIEVLWGC